MATTSEGDGGNRGRALPWPVLAAGALSAAALALSGPARLPAVALGLAFLASAVVRFRLPEWPMLLWSLRVVLFGAAGWTVFESNAPSQVFFSPEIFVGALLLAELAVQAWRLRPSGGDGGAVAGFLSGLVFLAACAEREHAAISALAAPFFLCLLLSFRRIPASANAPAERGRWGWGPVVAIAVVVALGAGLAEAGWAWRYRIYSWLVEVDRYLLSPPSGAGFTDSPRLGAGPGSTPSFVRVLQIAGPLGAPHLRGAVFESYLQGAWGPSPDARAWRVADRAGLRSDAPGPRCRVTRLRDGVHFVFSPLEAAGLDLGAVPADETEWVAAAGMIRVARAPPFAWEVVGAGSEPGPLAPPPDAETRARCLELPAELDPRVRALAAEVTAGRLDARTHIEAVVGHLIRTHAYSLTTDPGTGDPLTGFLLEKKAAHCEYFASAAVILLRCSGVPARYVSGYYAHERTGADEWTVRQQDAHAWAEAWIEGAGWVTVEATPGDGRPDQTAATAPFLQRAKEWFADALGSARAWLGRNGARAGAVAGAVALLWVLVRRLRRYRRPRIAAIGGGYSNPGPALVRIAARVEGLFERAGVPCPPEVSWSEHLATLAAAGRAPGRLDPDELRGFVAQYERVRFGSPEDAAATSALAATLERWGHRPGTPDPGSAPRPTRGESGPD